MPAYVNVVISEVIAELFLIKKGLILLFPHNKIEERTLVRTKIY